MKETFNNVVKKMGVPRLIITLFFIWFGHLPLLINYRLPAFSQIQ